MEEGREKVTAKGDITRTVVSGSRICEVESELLSADVDGRRVPKDAAVAGSECTWKAMEVSTQNGTEGISSSVDEEVSRNQESKQRNGGTTSVGDDHNSWMEREFVVCEHVEEIGKEQSPARVEAPPQKRRAAIRVESARKVFKRETKKKWWS